MKKLSKIVALLLAGAMAMVMLTACTGGGGGGTQDNSKEEQELMEQIMIRAPALQSLITVRICAESLLIT